MGLLDGTIKEVTDQLDAILAARIQIEGSERLNNLLRSQPFVLSVADSFMRSDPAPNNRILHGNTKLKRIAHDSKPMNSVTAAGESQCCTSPRTNGPAHRVLIRTNRA